VNQIELIYSDRENQVPPDSRSSQVWSLFTDLGVRPAVGGRSIFSLQSLSTNRCPCVYRMCSVNTTKQDIVTGISKPGVQSSVGIWEWDLGAMDVRLFLFTSTTNPLSGVGIRYP
jgi:hypothetical protein